MKNNFQLLKFNVQLIMLLFMFHINLHAQQQYDPTAITQEIDYTIDNHGDAHTEFRQKMTASQWQNFKESPIARNPSIFKRDLERSLTAMQLDDFKNEMNEDTRSSVTHFTARSMATYKGNGKWEMKLEAKNPNITQLTDNAYLITNNLMVGGNIIQQLQKIFLPKNATDIKQTTDTYDNAVFTYTLHVEESSVNFLLFFGIAIFLFGCIWQLVPMFTKKIKN